MSLKPQRSHYVNCFFLNSSLHHTRWRLACLLGEAISITNTVCSTESCPNPFKFLQIRFGLLKNCQFIFLGGCLDASIWQLRSLPWHLLATGEGANNSAWTFPISSKRLPSQQKSRRQINQMITKITDLLWKSHIRILYYQLLISAKQNHMPVITGNTMDLACQGWRSSTDTCVQHPVWSATQLLSLKGDKTRKITSDACSVVV